MQLADGFARLIRRAPDARLEQILRTPVRRPLLEGIFRQMPRHLDPAAAADLDATIRWRITHSARDAVDTYDLSIGDGRCSARRGESDEEPRVTITLDGAEFVKLATGNSDPMKAYFGGRISLAGDIMIAAKLQALFRIPGRTSGITR